MTRAETILWKGSKISLLLLLLLLLINGCTKSNVSTVKRAPTPEEPEDSIVATPTSTPVATFTPTPTPDTTNPVVGSGITSSLITSSSLRLDWGGGSDNLTETSQLRYRLVAASTSSAIDTISEVDLISGANLLLDYQTNVLASNISSLDDATTYYFALVVKDMAGNQALYPIVSVTTLAIATFNGWTHLRAVGAKNPIAFTGLATSPATVMVQFAAVTLTAGTVESYNIYRGTSPGQNFSSAYATGISASARTYIDNGAFSAGNIYYYSVAPVVGGVAIPPEDITDQEIKVTIPPENMVLVHRWIGNREMCELMGKAIDRSNNYRCIHTGTGSDGAFFDLGQSLLVDAYELGCNFSENGCSGGVCLGTTTPGTATINSVYYQRGSSSDTCYINTNGASSWLSIDDAANATQRATMASARPGLPPIAMISPVSANLICNAQSEVGFSGSKRLLHRREWLVAAAWDSTLSDATITTIES